MVGMPVDFDQPDNMAFLRDRGAGEQIHPHDDDRRILRTLKRVIEGKRNTTNGCVLGCVNLPSPPEGASTQNYVYVLIFNL